MGAARQTLHGVVVVDKPRGPTSFDVVRRVKRALRADRAGHTGTLDPMATGVLAVCVGEAVKLQQYLVEGDKGYEAEVAFGAATDTEDAEGAVVARGDPSGLTAAAVAAALPRFLGEIEQVPPMYSAVRVAGRRLHEAARAGETVERAPRRVRIDGLDLLAFEAAAGPEETARARIAVRCGKGTYVRTLAADLGHALGVPAHLAGLRRTRAGPYDLSRAVALEELERRAEAQAGLEGCLVPFDEALPFLPGVTVDEAGARDLAHGRPLPVTPPGPLFRASSAAGRLLAICAPAPGGGARPVRVFATRDDVD